MSNIKITITGNPGAGKSRLVHDSIIPWCKKSGFTYVDATSATPKAIEELENRNKKLCIVRELTPSMVKRGNI